MIIPKFRVETCGGFRVQRQDSIEAAAVLATLLPDPDAILLGGEVCKPGSRTYGALVDVEGKRYFLKRYNCRSWLYRVQNTVRRSRAVYTWQLAWRFLERAVPVPEPLLCLEERRRGLLGRSYVLMEAVPGQRLSDLWPSLPADRRSAIMGHTGILLGRMHRQGCLHGDLKWGNLLLASDSERLHLSLVDLDGGRQLPWPCKWLARRDLARFLEDLHRNGGHQLERLVNDGWRDAWNGEIDERQ